jgi:hypothetical protein
MSRHYGAALFMVAIGLLIVFGTASILPHTLRISYDTAVPLTVEEPQYAAAVSVVVEAKEERLVTPKPLKAIYMTACVASNPAMRVKLVSLVEESELNAIVIDIKDATGVISFYDEALMPNLTFAGACRVRDLQEFIAELHASGIYVIGRLSVFQDPYYSALRPDLAIKRISDGGVWKDNKGLSFIDVGAREYWDYIVDIARASHELGFDEINFDYVRYPTDGNMRDINYNLQNSSNDISPSKADVLESFFAYIYENLKDTGMKTSVDLFGMTTTVETDMGIGQVLERALPYFDYISPMVYPSHYPAGWSGFQNPAAYPYEVIKISMSKAVEREKAWQVSQGLVSYTGDEEESQTIYLSSKLRPWLQDFNLGATYDAEKVRAQIQATYDSGLTSWMLWSAGNKYTESALLPE